MLIGNNHIVTQKVWKSRLVSSFHTYVILQVDWFIYILNV